jgi:cytochrome c-type biogenesis protein CcmH/NrfG
MVALLVIIGAVIFLALTVPFIPTLAMDMMGMMLVDRPDDVEGWYFYGRLLEWKGHDIAAAAAYRSAVNLDPFHRDAWKRIGDLLTKLGDLEGADEAYGFSV